MYNIAYYEWYLSAPIEKHCNSYGTVLLTSVEMNHRMLKIINFSDGYKVTTNAFSMLLTVCWNRLTAWWIRLTVWQKRLTVWWNRLTLTKGLLTADWRWLTANCRFRPLNVKTLVYVFPWGHNYFVSQTDGSFFLCIRNMLSVFVTLQAIIAVQQKLFHLFVLFTPHG